MPLIVLERARDIGVFKDIEHTEIRENLIAAEFVVGSDVEKKIRRPLAAK